jgi:hypothetical protein
VGLIRRIDTDRVGVSAGVVGGLEDRDLMIALEQMSYHETGDAGADDGDSHGAAVP